MLIPDLSKWRHWNCLFHGHLESPAYRACRPTTCSTSCYVTASTLIRRAKSASCFTCCRPWRRTGGSDWWPSGTRLRRQTHCIGARNRCWMERPASPSCRASCPPSEVSCSEPIGSSGSEAAASAVSARGRLCPQQLSILSKPQAVREVPTVLKNDFEGGKPATLIHSRGR
jgi:hypothetical protein